MKRFWILLPCVLLLLGGCASYIDYGGGRYGVTRVSEERSPFGTNAGFAYLENCEGRTDPNKVGLQFSDCHPVTPVLIISSQGVGGQIVGGALTGLGFGLGNAFAPSNGASAVQSQSQLGIQNVTVPGKGH
jgi:hypothetical protein